MVKRLFACVLSITTAGVPPKQILKRPKQFHLITQMALVILTLSASITAYAEAPMDQIYQYVEEQLGYTREELALNQTAETEEGGLVFSLKLKEADPATNGLVIGELDAQGNFIRLEGPQAIDLRTQYVNDWQKNRFHYDTLYDLVQRWRPIVDALSPEELAEFDSRKHIRTIETFVHHDFRLPGSEHIAYEDAVAHAREALLQLPGWTQEKVGLMGISAEAFHVPLGMEQPVYQFIFERASSVEQSKAALSDGPYTFDQDAWVAKEQAVFGDNHPWRISIRIDAQTGAVVGTILVEYPPVTTYDESCFFLWDPYKETVGP